MVRSRERITGWKKTRWMVTKWRACACAGGAARRAMSTLAQSIAKVVAYAWGHLRVSSRLGRGLVRRKDARAAASLPHHLLVCPMAHGCSGRGVCINGTCACRAGFAGTQCGLCWPRAGWVLGSRALRQVEWQVRLQLGVHRGGLRTLGVYRPIGSDGPNLSWTRQLRMRSRDAFMQLCVPRRLRAALLRKHDVSS